MFSRDYKINKIAENIKNTKKEFETDKGKPLFSYEFIKNLWENDEDYKKYKKKNIKEKSKNKAKAAKEM